MFFLVALAPAVTLVWLGLQLLNEDRELLTQRQIERRQAVLDAVVRSLGESLTNAERVLVDGPLPAGMVRFVLTDDSIRAEPVDRVLWLPNPPPLPTAESAGFAEAEQLEFQGQSDHALVAYEAAARSPSVEVRAGGLLRLARIHRSRRDWDGALSAYRRLAAISGVAIEGSPAALLARRALCATLQESERTKDLAVEASRLETDLLAGSWLIEDATWQLTIADLARWTGHAVAVAQDRKAFSDVAAALWRDKSAVEGRRVMVVDEAPFTLLARSNGGRQVALAIGPSVLHEWTDAAVTRARESSVRLHLLSPDGGPLITGDSLTSELPSVKASVSESGLPWTVALSATGSSTVAAELAGRRRLLAIGLGAILSLFAGGSYFLWRVMERELAVARLQTDFVSAVSHEFRTPLTSLRHVTELLQEHDEVPMDRRRTFYEALARNTERLHRVVESLLDFARMESGRKPYDLRQIEIGAFASEVVEEFQKEAAVRGFTVDLRIDPSAPLHLRADRVSLANALWNLLDNAVKYSPDNRRVDVSVQRVGAAIEIAVRDYGIGIPAEERKEIFKRFVRGAKASRLGIKGTGLGLAMVSHIVDAHGGRIALESEEGVGSTFCMVLPHIERPREEGESASGPVPASR
jgi:signal transduction histidine kinase